MTDNEIQFTDELIAVAMHPAYRILARGYTLEAMQSAAYAYLEKRFGWVDEFDVQTFYTRHEMHIRHPRSPRIDFFQPDVIIQDNPRKDAP